MANWERKSQYLLREIVKFRTYIDTLTNAQALKEKIYAQLQNIPAARGARGEGQGETASELTARAVCDGVDGAKEDPEASQTCAA
jgi:hypothetical protein